MCELLGICSSAKVRPGRYFKVLRRRGQELPDGQGNPDGWGIALYPDGKAVQVIKEPIPAATSKLAEFLSTYEHLQSKVFIAHIRKATRGVVTYSNTHPFSREVMGKEYAFAHNGTIRNVRDFELERHKPVGDTDSERLFCYILSFIEERGICEWNEGDLLAFWKFLISINCWPRGGREKHNKLNMLLSDGEMLIGFRDMCAKGTLYKLLSEVPGQRSQGMQLEDEERMSIGVIATRPVCDDTGWAPMEPGELCAFRNGVQVFLSGKAA